MSHRTIEPAGRRRRGAAQAFATAGALLALAGAAAPGTAAPGMASSKPAAYPHAFAHADCAPWDGPALTIVLQRDPIAPVKAKGQVPPYRYPQLLVRIFLPEVPYQQWFPLPGMNGNLETGFILDCPAYGQCQDRPGRVLIAHRTKDLLRGEIRCLPPTPSGRETIFPFSAPILPVRMLCG